jgi:superfamily I DNA/RNA helicase
MDNERIRLLRALTKNTQAGIMVIGDDDQDILRWNRPDGLEATDYFQRFRQKFEITEKLVLRKNFRSGQRIVEHTQLFLKEHMPRESHRELEDFELLHVGDKSGQGLVKTDFDLSRLEDEIDYLLITEGVKSVAVLTRTNGDAILAYERLRYRFPGATLQGRDNIAIKQLRHVACWLESCEALLASHGNEKLNIDLLETIDSHYKASGIPETRETLRHKEIIYIDFLWDTLQFEDRDATLKDHIDQLSDMDLDSYGRLLFNTTLPKWVERRNELWGGDSRIIVSTIHKVKGLEFDAVLLLPSASSFPFNGQWIDYKDKADEVRLFYVGMTRAKSYLLYSFGPRENAWLRMQSYQSGVTKKQLVGSLDEVFISFPAKADLNCQEYIELNVSPGDPVRVSRTQRGGTLISHDNRAISMLSSAMNRLINFQNVKLHVHSIIRHEVRNDLSIPGMIPLEEMQQIVRQRGWFYTVIFEGKIN